MSIEAMKLALEALEYMSMTAERYVDNRIPETAITAIKEALAQPEQEPVAWMHQNKFTGKTTIIWDLGLATPNQNWKPLYTHPPQRKPLTDDEIIQIVNANSSKGLYLMAKAIEAKLKQKNGFSEENT